MKHVSRTLLALSASAVLAAALAMSGCASQNYVTSIAKTGTDGTQDIYTITYSDGSTDTFTVTNGKDGQDGEDADINAIYEAYKELTGKDVTFEEFLAEYLSTNSDMSTVIGSSLQSVAKIYAEFVETETVVSGGSIFRPQYTTRSAIAVATGAAVIYQMDENADGYTYFVTDYHVIYDNKADASRNNADGTKIARSIHAYLYGSEGAPSAVDANGDGYADTDENGYAVYDYGDQAIELEYVGGTITYDIAVLRARTSDVKAINEDAKAVTLADEYHVGEAAIAIGNPEGNGLSVTQGIISTESEYITLSIDDTPRSYRSVRIDTALYSGNSGGGLFNKNGELIGITNAGNQSDQNINYAVPLDIVKNAADSILFYDRDGNDGTNGVYRLMLGVTVTTQNSRYVYDSATGYGRICEEVVLSAVNDGSVADQMGLAAGDILTAVILNGKTYEISRSFEIEDLSLTVRANDIVQFVYTRDGGSMTTDGYTVSASSLTSIG